MERDSSKDAHLYAHAFFQIRIDQQSNGLDPAYVHKREETSIKLVIIAK